MTIRTWIAAVGLAAVGLTGCSDDVVPQDPAEFTTGAGDDDELTTSTTGTMTTSTTDPDPTSSSGTTTGTSGGTDTTGPATGGIDVDPPPGVSNASWVNAGQAVSSENYRGVFTLGQLSPAQQQQSSPNYRLRGGVVGANTTP